MTAFFKNLTTFKKIPNDPYQIVGAFFCMILTLLIGYVAHDLTIGSFASLGIFTFLYYRQEAYQTLLPRLVLIGLFLIAGNALGMLATLLPWTIPFVVGIVGGGARLFFRLYEIRKPGAFFIVMVTAMGTSTRIPLQQQPVMSGYFVLGIVIAIGMAAFLCFLRPEPIAPQRKRSFQERFYVDAAAFLDSLFYGTILFVVTYVSLSLELSNPYWMVVSAAAILQGDNLRAMMERNLQRLLGTLAGLGIAAVLLNLALTNLLKIMVIALLFVTVEAFVKRNYAVANFFSTPMALLLTSLAKQQYVYSLLQQRFLGIFLGGLLGLAGAWLMISSLRFYNRTFLLQEDLERETE